MPDILTSDEIKSLKQITKGIYSRYSTVDGREIKPYDFRCHSSITKKSLQLLENIDKGYASKVGRIFTTKFQIIANVSFKQILEATYADYLYKNKEDFATFQCACGDLNMQVDMSLPLASLFIDKLTGTDGTQFQSRLEMSEIDTAILSNTANLLISTFASSIPHCSNISPSISVSPLESKSQLKDRENTIISSFKIQMGGRTGQFNIILPQTSIERMFPDESKNTQELAKKQYTPKEVKNIISESIEDVPIECTAILGKTTLTTNDIINLQKGDIIRLDGNCDTSIEFWVANKQAYIAKLGQAGRNVGIILT